MDATVDDFFNEINKISSKEETRQEIKEKDEIVWQECYDELTGYSYFWNTESDEVTWVPPKLYKPAENAPKKKETDQKKPKDEPKTELFVPPTSTQTKYSPSDIRPEVKEKVYSIQEVVKKPEGKPKTSINIISNIMIKSEAKKRVSPVRKEIFKRADPDSDDEKIELITEYGGDSDSDNEIAPSAAVPHKVLEEKLNFIKPVIPEPKKPISPQNNKADSDNDEEDDDDEYDLLAKIQQRAKELKTLGGELPSSVKNIIKETITSPKLEKPKAVSGFSLVAGYNSDSSESESETSEPKNSLPAQTSSIFPIPPPVSSIDTTSHSTLFPITQPINVKDFIGAEQTSKDIVKESNESENNDFDNKAFQRKRRIGISLVNNAKKSKEDDNLPESELKGFGFKSEEITSEKDAPTNVYPGFQKGGVMFVKSDVLKPEDPPDVKKEDLVKKVADEDSKVNKKETEDDYSVLREKLLFLGEGREPVLPVQAMLIQAETLFLAMKEGGLKLSYLYKWLKEMCSELIKLEKEAAPEGWLLQWDRSHKRYYYQNPTSGLSQWKYPEPDVTRCDDAMDISTTPPPPPDDRRDDEADSPPPSGGGSPIMFGPQLPPEPPLPPSPPKIRSPSPPPPPIISMSMERPAVPDVPLPPLPQQIQLPPPPPPGLPSQNGQPLPPGIDISEDSFNKPKAKLIPSDTLSNALDSFYSEIAEVTENTNSLSPNPVLPTEVLTEIGKDIAAPSQPESAKKKKKKVKLAQGLTMKKKGVSELVEKWKSVQKTYKD